MTTLSEAAQQALVFTMRDFASLRDFEAARAVLHDNLCAALAEPVQPVAWLVKDEGLYWTEEAAIRRADRFVEPLDVVPLYTTPPAPQPLTIERQRDALLEALKELTGHANERFTGGVWDRARAAIAAVEEARDRYTTPPALL